MDSKTSVSKKNAEAKATKNAKGAGQFFGDVKAEFNKISWTSKDELRFYTRIVVSATFLLGLGIYSADLFIQTSMSYLSRIVQVIVG
jgi:preprotein translocase subunit SecE